MVGTTGMRKHMAPRDDLTTSRMWKSMRQLRQFTRGDIIATAEATSKHVEKFVQQLKGAGYIEVVQRSVSNQPEIMRLAKNTGPVAPRFGQHGCYDANIAEPALRPGDRALNRHAPALLATLRLVVDRCRSLKVSDPLLDEAEALILKSEGRA